MVQLPIYLDNHATTRCDPRVVAAMLPYFTEKYGNAASINHVFGTEAQEAVARARRQVAELIGASDSEIIFTSGATESNNLALKGVARMYRHKGNHLITVATEHKAVLDPCKRLAHEGYEVTILPVDEWGLLDPQQVAEAIRPQTILVSVMLANNEIGTLQPLADIGRICRERGVWLHTDAAQAVGKIPVHVDQLQVDLLSLSGHKIYGPKGVGALYLRKRDRRVRVEPQIDGGGQESGLRSGTLPVPLIVGLGEACRLCRELMPEESQRIRELRDRLWLGLRNGVDGIRLNGHPTHRLPNNLNVSFAGVKGEALLLAMKDVAVSTGSACTTARLGPSHVLKAIGLDDEQADASVRFGLGRFNTEAEIDWVIAHVIETVRQLRRHATMWAEKSPGVPVG
ncbi:MAG: IscS subfamily cysteine desulfurase [Gemmatales bacterium]|nr:IscS subfamily cysteine desulfurase [Gemmatales bacterium]MDW8223173.1 IscS subfamily cysteine desulfurase [Gemmatales bacterium]